MECRVAVGVSGVRPGAEWSCAWRVESGVGGGELGQAGEERPCKDEPKGPKLVWFWGVGGSQAPKEVI
jgi:hypothetical protein